MRLTRMATGHRLCRSMSLRSRGIQMAKILRCQDVGMKCDFVARGETEQEVLKRATEHAGATHNMKSIPPEMLAKVRAAVRDE